MGEEGPSSLQDVNRLLPKDERRRMVAQVRIHADEPGSNCLRRLPLKQELDDLIGVAQALFGVRMGHLSQFPLRRCAQKVEQALALTTVPRSARHLDARSYFVRLRARLSVKKWLESRENSTMLYPKTYSSRYSGARR